MVRRHTSGGSTEPGGEADPVVRERFDWSETPPSLGVVLALSQLEDADPLSSTADRPTPLHEYVDPDALDAVFGTDPAETLSVSLSIEGYQVRIGGGEVVVVPSDP